MTGESGTNDKTPKRGRRKTFVGVVVSNKMDKTVVVRVEQRVLHPLYKKHVVRRKKFMAHDEHNECQEGDVVRIMETRPLSKRKRWRVVEILRRAQVLHIPETPEEEEKTLEQMLEEERRARQEQQESDSSENEKSPAS